MEISSVITVGVLIGIGAVSCGLATRALKDEDFTKYFWSSIVISVLALLVLVMSVGGGA